MATELTEEQKKKKQKMHDLMYKSIKDKDHDLLYHLITRDVCRCISPRTFTPLHYAAMLGNTYAINMFFVFQNTDEPLHEYCWKYSDVECTYYTPLFFAVISGHIKAVLRILQEGYDVNEPIVSPDGCKFTCLQSALYYGQERMARLLLHKGARVDMYEHESSSPLAIAREKNYVKTADYIEWKDPRYEEKYRYPIIEQDDEARLVFTNGKISRRIAPH